MPYAHWPVLVLPSDGTPAPIRVLSHYQVSGSTFNSTFSTPDSFRLQDIDSIYPIGSSQSSVAGAGGGMYGWTLAVKMKDGTLRLQTVTDSSSSTSSWNRLGSYLTSPNATVRNLFSAKGAGISTGGQNTGSYYDNLVIVAEPYQITP